MTSRNKRLLEGLQTTAKVSALYKECLAYCQSHESKPLLTTVSTDDSEELEAPNDASITSRVARLLRPLSLEEAVTVVLEFDAKTNKSQKKSLPIPVLRALHVVLQSSQQPPSAQHQNNLDEALSHTQLAFSAPVSTSTKSSQDQAKFQARMDRLKLQHEATQYCHLTHNIDSGRNQQDDVTTKSMTYAASVGLNMIVAPLSFGVFMYFFSGPLLNVAFERFQPTHPGAVDVRKVIIGVLSGVGMLFVEMMLFVIRTHEFERGMRRKDKKQKSVVKPFGDYSSATPYTYTSGVGNGEIMVAAAAATKKNDKKASRGKKNKAQ